MGRVKDYIMDLEEAKMRLIDTLQQIRKDENIKLFETHSIKFDLLNFLLSSLLIEITYDQTKIKLNLIDLIRSQIFSIDNALKNFLESPESNFSPNLLNKAIEIANTEYIKYRYLNDNSIKGANSEEYYNQNINELQLKIQELQDNLSAESQNNENANKLIEDLISQKEIYEKELALRKKQLDLKEDWKNKIEETFNVLKSYLLPVKNEQIRLNWLFWIYLILSVLLVVAVVIIEFIAVNKVYLSDKFPDFKQYITVFLPIPIVGAMLWAFIYQMNRAQRQLIVIAKSIHKVEYVQGLLLAINKLAPNVEDGITRINAALDKLINNHLNENEVNSEEDIIKEEKKDVVPVESLIKILKELKGVVGKE